MYRATSIGILGYFAYSCPTLPTKPQQGGNPMIVTATEFKKNFGRYLELVASEEIFITKNGKTIAKVINPQVCAVAALRGILKGAPEDLDRDRLREARLSCHEDHL